MARPQVASIIHYGARIDYAVTNAEPQQLASGGNTAWKDTCLVVAAALIIAGIALFAAIASGIAWRKTVRSRRELVQEIRSRTRSCLTILTLLLHTRDPLRQGLPPVTRRPANARRTRPTA